MRLLIITIAVSICDVFSLNLARQSLCNAYSVTRTSLGARSRRLKLHMGIVRVEDNDPVDDEDDEKDMELLSFKEQNEFLEAMKALVEKTGSFGEESAAVAEKEVQVQTDREMKLKNVR